MTEDSDEIASNAELSERMARVEENVDHVADVVDRIEDSVSADQDELEKRVEDVEERVEPIHVGYRLGKYGLPTAAAVLGTLAGMGML